VTIRRAGWWIVVACFALAAAILFAPPEPAAPADAPAARVEAPRVVSRPAPDLPTSEAEPTRPPLRRLRVSMDNAIPVSEEMLAMPGETHFWKAPLLEPEPPTYTQDDPDWSLEEWNDPEFFAGIDPTEE
jgi:hypothetical protein